MRSPHPWFFAPLALASLAPAMAAQTPLYRLDGAAPGAEYGSSLALLGDLDGDGAEDFAAGAPREAARQGVVRIHSGRTGAVLALVAGAGPDDFFGQALAAVGDLDGDGARELVVGAPEREIFVGDCEAVGGGLGTVFGPGYVTVVSGASGAVLYTLPAPGGPAETFGFALAGGGDVNGDGGPDFLVPLGHAGRVDVYDAASGALLRADDLSALGSAYSAAFLGAVDGNPGDEYAVGWVDYAGCLSGGVRAFRGGGSPFWNDVWCNLGDEYGYFVTATGDVDGDGVAEVVACGLDSAGFACSGFGFERTLSGLDGALLYHSTGFKLGARGRSAAGLLDLDGDGLRDLAVAEPGLLSSTGEALRVVKGLTGNAFMQLESSGDGDRFGSALAAADVNGDGLQDLLVGARRDDDGGPDAGAVHAFTLFLGPTSYCQAQVNSQGCAPAIFATGMPSLSYNSFRVKAAQVVNNKTGLLFWGAVPKQTPFSGGWLCVAAPLKRTGAQSSGGNPPPDDCSGAFSFHFNKPYMTQEGLLPGTQVYCQYWSRDPASASTTNLTDALAFTVQP